MSKEEKTQSTKERNKDDHSITHFLLALILIINLVMLWLVYNIYVGQNQLADEYHGDRFYDRAYVISDY